MYDRDCKYTFPSNLGYQGEQLKMCNKKDFKNVNVTAVAQWLRRCATNRKVAGSIPAGVIGIFH